MVVVEWDNTAILSVTKEGAVVSTLTGGRQENDDEENVEEVFVDGQGANTRFNIPSG